jgi:hypothetical protein
VLVYCVFVVDVCFLFFQVLCFRCCVLLVYVCCCVLFVCVICGCVGRVVVVSVVSVLFLCNVSG